MEKNQINISKKLIEDFTYQVKQKYPLKCFGYFISSKKQGDPDEFIIFQDNTRNSLKGIFESYGEYYVRYEDAGFCTTDEETYKVNKELVRRKKYIVGIFHSHQRHPAIFSGVDADMHVCNNIWHLIISLRNFEMPQIKAFSLNGKHVKELKIVVKEEL